MAKKPDGSTQVKRGDSIMARARTAANKARRVGKHVAAVLFHSDKWEKVDPMRTPRGTARNLRRAADPVIKNRRLHFCTGTTV